MPASETLAGEISNVTCPFCGLLCDDLRIVTTGDRLSVRANGCRIATAAFERAASPPTGAPRIGGKEATFQEAAREAARLIRGARQPLLAGLATDVEGMRAAGRLAERSGATLDHMNSAATMRNLMVLQDAGWITTTLSEVRNRADLLIAAGTDIVGRFPRFFERCLPNRETLFSSAHSCDIVFLGRGVPEGLKLPGPPPEVILCDVARLSEAFGVLRAMVAGRPLTAAEAAGRPLAVWRQLAERMQAARYGVVAWAAADFDFPHAELTVQALCELVKDLNQTTRFSGLPLGGSDGDLTADTVHLWQTGFATRTSYGEGKPDHDPYHYSTARLLQSGGADLLVWISSLSEMRAPPVTSAPTVVLGRAGMGFERDPSVFIPVGTPGIDHAGHLFRADRVVALPLGRLRESALPSVAEAIAAIEAVL
jgi:formylmethanofuran dehydrogenase subunit B